MASDKLTLIGRADVTRLKQQNEQLCGMYATNYLQHTSGAGQTAEFASVISAKALPVLAAAHQFGV